MINVSQSIIYYRCYRGPEAAAIPFVYENPPLLSGDAKIRRAQWMLDQAQCFFFFLKKIPNEAFELKMNAHGP